MSLFKRADRWSCSLYMYRGTAHVQNQHIISRDQHFHSTNNGFSVIR